MQWERYDVFFRIPVKMPPSWDCKNRGDIAGEVGRNIRWVRSELPGGERGELWGASRGLGAKS